MSMNSVQIKTPPSFKRKNSLECNCETINKKFYTVCDLCSENKFLRKSSTKILLDNSTFSE